MNAKCLPHLMLLTFLFPGNCSLSARADTLLGLEVDTGNLYQVSTVDASLVLIGNTAISMPASLEFAPNGSLYSFTSATGTNSVLYRIDPNTAHATVIGPLGLSLVFEGGLAFAPDGTAYGANANQASDPKLFRLNLATGQATIIGTISGGNHDINGLAWRSDGILVGLDRVSNSLLSINPQTAASSIIAPLNPVIGSIGGMTAQGDTGYFSTAGPTSTMPGSNELYSFNLFSGAYTKIGAFSPTIQGKGLCGLALVPLPRLSISPVGSASARVAWATYFTDHALEFATTLPGAIWYPITNMIAIEGDRFTVTFDTTAAQRVYRLRKP